MASPNASADRIVDIDHEEVSIPSDGQKIKALEAQVAELNSTIKVEEGLKLTEKATRESAIATEAINKKNHSIDVMRIKLNRYEFAVKEAIIFLGKPMLNYEEWLARGGTAAAGGTADGASSSQQLTPGQMAEKQQAQQHGRDHTPMPLGEGGKALVGGGPPNFEVLCMECMRLALNYLRNAQASVVAMTRSGLAGAEQSLPKLNLEINGIEVESVTSGRTRQGSRDTEPSPGRMSGTRTPPNGAAAGGPLIHAAGSQGSLRSGRSASASASGTTGLSSMHERTASAQKAASALFNAATSLPEDDESDLATNSAMRSTSGPGTPTGTGPRCTACRELRLQVHVHQTAIEGLKSDITALADELEEERGLRDRLQLSKDILDQELEELTAQLFDQANRMVIDEAKMRDELEQSNRQLRGELGEVASKFHRRDSELKALRAALRQLEAAKLRSTSHVNLHSNLISPTSPLGSYSNLTGGIARRGSTLRKQSIIGSPYGSNPTLHAATTPSLTVDGIIFSEFQDHVKDAMSSGVVAPNSSTFLKRCMVEDIEPCLFYVYHQDTGGIFKAQSGGLSTSGRKRLLDNVSRGQCEISPLWTSRESLLLLSNQHSSSPNSSGASPSSPSPGTTSFTSSAATTRQAPRVKCQTCSLVRDCDYKIRFTKTPLTSKKDAHPADTSPHSHQPQLLSTSPPAPTPSTEQMTWHPVCRFCRDRVLSVLEFFAFLAHIRDGVKQGATLLGMFRQALWLRRRMAVCRIGSAALFEGDVGAASGYSVGGIGRFEQGGEWEKNQLFYPAPDADAPHAPPRTMDCSTQDGIDALTQNLTDAYADTCNEYQSDALLDQLNNISYVQACVGPMATLMLHLFILALLGDRLMGLKHKPTIWFFSINVALNIFYSAWGILCNIPSFTWFFEYTGTQLYFYVDGFVAAFGEFTVSYLTYLRISPSIRQNFGRRVDRFVAGLVFIVLGLELAKSVGAAVEFTIAGNYDQSMYNMPLVYVALSYKAALDLGLCGYGVIM
ncbi:rab guanine nucleotide exchange factor S2 [Thoreauomyces humboldtii]|nr:rab guanine nucleotide exchange factor S2 [Thoreauomyces humboldtii]